MSDDAAVLAEVRAAFARCPRPAHFTDYTHCPECAEHDELLRSRDPDTLRIADVGNPGWDPLCYVDAAGFAYLFPGLARLTLADRDSDEGWYVDQLLFHLTYDGAANRHLRGFDPDQRRAVVRLLRHVAEARSEVIAATACTDELATAIDLWSAELPAPEPARGPGHGAV